MCTMGRAAQAGLADGQVSSSLRERLLKFHFAEALKEWEGTSEWPGDCAETPLPTLLLPWFSSSSVEDFRTFWHSFFVDQE